MKTYIDVNNFLIADKFAKMTLKEVLAGETTIPKIKVKVIKKIGESAIVGDASGLAICCASNII